MVLHVKGVLSSIQYFPVLSLVQDANATHLFNSIEYFALANKYVIGEIKLLCKNYEEEPIFQYVAKRIVALEANMVSFIEYEALIRQMRATYRGEIYKEQLNQDTKKTI